MLSRCVNCVVQGAASLPNLGLKGHWHPEPPFRKRISDRSDMLHIQLKKSLNRKPWGSCTAHATMYSSCTGRGDMSHKLAESCEFQHLISHAWYYSTGKALRFPWPGGIHEERCHDCSIHMKPLWLSPCTAPYLLRYHMNIQEYGSKHSAYRHGAWAGHFNLKFSCSLA